jgi:hypothetical protein
MIAGRVSGLEPKIKVRSLCRVYFPDCVIVNGSDVMLVCPYPVTGSNAKQAARREHALFIIYQ